MIGPISLALGLLLSTPSAKAETIRVNDTEINLDHFTIPETEEHGPDEEAEEIRQARIKEIEFNESFMTFDGFDDVDFATAIAQARKCKYISSISTPPPRGRVALTFDDGPNPVGTPHTLKVLKKYNIKATFFMMGRNAKAYPDLVQKVLDDGHQLIGNHSWSHRSFHGLSYGEQAKEIVQTQGLLEGYQTQKFFRYPYGNSTCEGNNIAHSRGYRIVGWHVDTCDWGFNKTGSVSAKDASICGVKSQYTSDFVGHVIQQVRSHKGGIILMHDVQPNTIKKLESIIIGLRNAGYEFGTIDEAGFEPSLR